MLFIVLLHGVFLQFNSDSGTLKVKCSQINARFLCLFGGLLTWTRIEGASDLIKADSFSSQYNFVSFIIL